MVDVHSLINTASMYERGDDGSIRSNQGMDEWMNGWMDSGGKCIRQSNVYAMRDDSDDEMR